MTNKEDIEQLLAIKKLGCLTDKDRHALNSAIKALEERPKGEWLVVGHDDTTYWYRCSICEHEEHDNFTKHYHYCPSCGADMWKVTA